jgi:hypothetical protein
MTDRMTSEDEIRAALEQKSEAQIGELKRLVDFGRDEYHTVLSRIGLAWIMHTSKGALKRAMDEMEDIEIDTRRGGPDMALYPDSDRSMVDHYRIKKSSNQSA